MRPRTYRLAAVAAALALFGAVPAPAAADDPPCQALVSGSTGSETAIVLEGHYTYSGPYSSISDAHLTCHVVQNGVRVVSVSDDMTGPTAITISDQRIDPFPFHVCYEVAVWRTIGPQPSDYPSSSNC
jgi:hypothetical protein